MSVTFFDVITDYEVEDGRFSNKTEALKYYKSLGVERLDVFESSLNTYPISYYSKLLESVGMSIGCLITHHSIAHEDKTIRECQIAKAKEQLDSMANYGVPMMMLQPRMEPAKNSEEYKRRQEWMIEGFSELTEHAKSVGVTMTLENMSLLNRTDCTISEIKYLLDNVPDLKFILDTGNFLCVGEDALTAYRTFRDKIVHIHCKDWVWCDFGGFVREKISRFEGCYLGEGVIPLQQILKEAKADGYNGDLMVEVNLSYHPDWHRFDKCISFLQENF